MVTTGFCLWGGGGYMGVGSLAKPCSVDATHGNRVKGNLFRIGGIVNVVHIEARHGLFGTAPRNIGDEFAVLNQRVANDLHLVVVGIGRMGNLADQARILWIGNIQNRQGHFACPHMGNVGVLAVLDNLHPIATSIQIVMADKASLLCVALLLHLTEV